MKHFLSSPHKGMLLYHKLGSGKTCTSIMIADSMLRREMVNHVFVIAPGSLRSGWIEEYCKKCGIGVQYIRKKFTFITYNFDTSRELHKFNFDNSLVIIDEVHNFINGVKNDSKSYTSIYNKIDNSTCRVLALSGTPVTNSMHQLGLLGNMLKKDAFNDILTGEKDFSEEKLNRTFIGTDILNGIISYFPGDSKSYPTVHYHNPIKMQMSREQFIEYTSAVNVEKNSHKPEEKLKQTDPVEYNRKMIMYIKAVQHIPTRSASNFCYNKEDKNIVIKKKNGETEEEEIILPDKFKKDGGWITSDTFIDRKMINKYSPKFAALFINIVMNYHTKHMVYTFFVNKSGIEMLETLLNNCGITTAIFYGKMSDKQRVAILKKFNSPENRNGDIIRVILVSEAGNAGITLLETNNVHILESSNNEIKTQQAIGRAARFKSHINMPPNRQYVNVWRYWSTTENNEILGIDEILYQKGVDKEIEIKKISDMIIANSIENTS
jgi:SNF2 family DNA or RNA helicase